jgi:hypothetical protein
MRREIGEPLYADTFLNLVENFYGLARRGARQIAAA